MFPFSVNKPMKVYRSGSFCRRDGVSGSYIICLECDNQPPEIETPSKSRMPIKFWLESALPKGICNDGYIVFDTIKGGELRTIPAIDINGNIAKDKYGKIIYNTELVLNVEGLRAYY